MQIGKAVTKELWIGREVFDTGESYFVLVPMPKSKEHGSLSTTTLPKLLDVIKDYIGRGYVINWFDDKEIVGWQEPITRKGYELVGRYYAPLSLAEKHWLLWETEIGN